jgi:Family of unknown function (DUF6159)
VIAGERGETPRVRDGLRAARRRLPAILGWTALSTVVAQALGALERLPAGESIGGLVGALGDLAWSVATFFVIPILALEPVNARGAVRRSARTFRDRWGEAVTGDVTIGVVFGVLSIPGFVVGFAGADRLDHHAYALGVTLLAIAVVAVVPLLVVGGALTELFMLALYRYATAQGATGPFTEGQLAAAVQPAGRRWWQRGGA